MPAYNSRPTVRLAVTSTLTSMSELDELIVIDDGSTDETLDEVSRINDSRLRLVSNASNLGISATLNHGLEIAEHDLVARMDADDITLPWRFKHQRKILANKDADFVFTNCFLMFSDRFPVLLPNVLSRANTRQLAKLMTQTNPFIHPTALFRRQAVLELGGYRDVPNEDFDLWQRGLIAGYSMWRTGTPSIIFRVHKGQVTQSANWTKGMLRNASSADFTSLQEVSGDVRLNFMMRTLEIPALMPKRSL